MEGNRRPHKCDMCLFSTGSRLHLMQHSIKRHRYDPRFRVKCTIDGCQASYKKWQSFQQHLKRNHRQFDVVPLNEQNDPDDALDDNAHENLLEENHGENVGDPALGEDLKVDAGRYLLHLREVCNTSTRALEAAMTGTQSLIEKYLAAFIAEVTRGLDRDQLFNVEHLHACVNRYPPERVFSLVDSRRKMDRFMSERLNFITPSEIEFGERYMWRRKPTLALVRKKTYGYYIPLLASLKRMLLNDDIRNCVDNPRDGEGVMKTLLHGNYFKSHPFFSSTRNPLAITFYYDEVEVVNPLGSRTHKLGMFYWSLANVYPEFRSTLRNINLFAVAKYADIKKFGIAKVLEKFAADVRKLQSEGVTVNVRGQNKIYKGSLLMVTGDTPASAAVGGFKKSVSAARPCRRCMTDLERLKLYFVEDLFELRSMQKHDDHLVAVTLQGTTQETKDFWKKQYGVNERTALMSIEHFDVTKCLVQDTMHILAEGVVEVATRLFIDYCIYSKKYLTLAELNAMILNFDYGHLSPDKPSTVLHDHIKKNFHLRQTAAQMICLTHVLPFLVSDRLIDDEDGAEDPEGRARLMCHVKLLQILNICFAYEVTADDAEYLKTLIQEFLTEFSDLYGQDSLVPKFHFLVHLPAQILEFGPLRQQFCFRFEAAHARVKFLARVVRCFKNLPWTTAYRYESLRSLEFSMDHEPQSKFLYQGHFIKEGTVRQLGECAHANLVLPLLPVANADDCPVMLTTEVKMWGSSFLKGGIVLVRLNDNYFPTFGQIQNILVHDSKIIIVYKELLCTVFNPSLNAYRVQTRYTNEVFGAYNLEDSIYPHALSIFMFEDSKYVLLLNHTRTELI